MFDSTNSHAERKTEIMRVLLHWMILFSIGSVSFGLLSGVLGWEQWESLYPVFAAGTLRIGIAIAFLVLKPSYPYGNALLVTLMFVLSSLIIFDTEAVQAGRFMIYLILPLVVAGAILPPRTIIVVSVAEIAIVILFMAATGQHIVTWMWYGLLAYSFIAALMYLTAQCMYDLIEKLDTANEIRRTVINGVTEGLLVDIEEAHGHTR